MRKSVIASMALHVLVGTCTVLWLLWCFVPGGNVVKALMTLLVIFLALRIIWIGCRHKNKMTDNNVTTEEFIILDTQGPVVLVCGDSVEELFQGQQLRKTAQGWWLRIDDVSQLTNTVCNIQQQQPCLAGQLSVMYVCRPDQYENEAEMRAPLKSLRDQAGKLTTLLGFSLPIFLSCEFFGPQTPWVIIRGANPLVSDENDSQMTLADWQQQGEHLSFLPLLSQAYTFTRELLIDELEKSDRLYPPVEPFAVVLRSGSYQAAPQSLWARWLYSRTCLRFTFQVCDKSAVSRFPDAILPLLSPYATPVQGGLRTRRLVCLLWFCALAALGFSAINNQRLIYQIGTDLQRWSAIPMNHYEPKARSLAALQQDALLLERWQRQGEPYRYGLGYYSGQRLWLALQQAIDTYVPPPAPAPKPVPKIVRLNSMSLFDTGKSELKSGSTKLLVNSLVGIKAKPGWLIVVAGHTDSTGDEKSNQILSLKRAESVRDWMRDTGDVPESCFAVQGYGESRPIATNDTLEGRTLNRRVEISLVPQANACQVPGNIRMSLQSNSAPTHEIE